MLFLLFQIANERYAVEAGRVVEVMPLVNLRRLPQSVNGLAGLFNYRGHPVPAVDLSQLVVGRPCAAHLSTRIVVVEYPESGGRKRLLGLIAERATEMLRTEPENFVETGLNGRIAPALGPIFMDSRGPVQWLRERRLLPENVEAVVFADEPGALP